MVTPRRPPVATVAFVDDYCQRYQHLFDQVRNFEAFKFLHLGMLSEMKRKSLPAIARAVGLEDSQELHHFLRDSPWDVAGLRQTRLWITQLFIGDREIVLCIDETGDKKKGLSVKKSPGRPPSIPPEVLERLKRELADEEGFKSYGEVRTWLPAICGIEADYKVVHKTVRYRLKSKLKVPRPVSVKQAHGTRHFQKKTPPTPQIDSREV
jgi:hypothetical protein